MQEHITIVSTPSENQSENYDFLRKEGIDYLQEIVGDIWTDYNVHDPGVTILEILCYAITDLGYRTNLDIKDILAVNPDDPTEKEYNNFFTAREILTNGPWTINDYRKLLIDVDGVKNAWLEPATSSEVDVYLQNFPKKLTFDKADNTKITLNGLYTVLLEFDVSEKYGDLNDNSLIAELEITEGDLAGLQLEVTTTFYYWDHVWEEGKSWANLPDIKSAITAIDIRIEEELTNYEVALAVDEDNIITAKITQTDGDTLIERPDLEMDLLDTIAKLFDESGETDPNLLTLQQEKVKETKEVLDRVKRRLNANRNLCEDFVNYKALRIEEIVICADIELKADANAEEVLAEVYELVGQFLAPYIQFYGFTDMVKKGWTSETIFEGPRLDNGFIDTNELEATTRRKSIHVSDLINIIMDIEGVIAIKEIKIGNIPLGEATGIASKSVYWCLDLAWDKNYVPRLSYEKSKIVFYKKGIPFIPDIDEVADLLEEKEAERIAVSVAPDDMDIAIPNGNSYDLDDYTTIQDEFPENYGIGPIGLPAAATDLRKAQAHQLKGYLLFFDQLLANYCAQLENIKALFSINKDIDRTYFHQSLFDISNVAYLYKSFIDGGDFEKNPAKDIKSDFLAKWETYKSQDALNTEAVNCATTTDKAHGQEIGCIIESKETFLERRNEFLDHLLARFAEQFSDYALLTYKLDGPKVKEELIKDKLAFLREYPSLSYGRGQAFNYLKPGWNSNNVSGLQKRIARLLGFDHYGRRNLACPPPIQLFEKFKDTEEKWRFRLKSPKGNILLKSEAYNSPQGRAKGMKSVIKNGIDWENYTLDITTDEEYYYNLKALNGEIIGTSNFYANPEDRDKAVLQLIQVLSGDCTGEGFYLIEHILLRPRTTDDRFLPVSFQEDCYCAGNEDAWSFRATCILPYWIGRFTNMDFRNFVEKTIRQETPAHIFMKICWINPTQMKEFQEAYKAWLKEMENCPPNQEALTQKQNQLIDSLEKLRTVYPAGYLYDCKETGNSPVTLGQSILGTFIPEENE